MTMMIELERIAYVVRKDLNCHIADKQKMKGRMLCKHCSGKGHLVESCLQLIGYPE